MPEIAKLVTLDLKQRKLFVDGAEFPWPITEEGVHVEHGVDEIGRVSLTFLADAIEVLPREVRESADEPQVASQDRGR